MIKFEYPVLLTPVEEGGFVVTCRDLPEVITQGENEQDALRQASDAMEEAFAVRINDCLDFPQPSRRRRNELLVSPPAGMVAKAALYVAMREANVTKIDLAKRLGIDEREVRRLLDPHHGSRLPRIEAAIDSLGMRLRIELARS